MFGGVSQPQKIVAEFFGRHIPDQLYKPDLVVDEQESGIFRRECFSLSRVFLKGRIGCNSFCMSRLY
jgi:hypothetical protein